MLLGFANYRLLNETSPIDSFSAKENSLENTDTSSKSSISEIEDFLPLGDKDKVLLDFWPIIKKL